MNNVLNNRVSFTRNLHRTNAKLLFTNYIVWFLKNKNTSLQGRGKKPICIRNFQPENL